MSHNHVAVRAGRFVKARALVDPNPLWHVDLNVVDEVAVPDRLEQSVCEAEGEDVLNRLLAQKVIDAEDLLLRKYLMQTLIEIDGTRKVRAERLLHHDARVGDEIRLSEQVHGRERRVRWHA